MTNDNAHPDEQTQSDEYELAQLTDLESKVFYLLTGTDEGLTSSHIAARLEVPVDAVKAARAGLRQKGISVAYIQQSSDRPPLHIIAQTLAEAQELFDKDNETIKGIIKGWQETALALVRSDDNLETQETLVTMAN